MMAELTVDAFDSGMSGNSSSELRAFSNESSFSADFQLLWLDYVQDLRCLPQNSFHFLKNECLRDGETDGLIGKGLATKADDLSLIPEMNMTEGEKKINGCECEVPLISTDTVTCVYMHTYTCTFKHMHTHYKHNLFPKILSHCQVVLYRSF